MNELIWRAPILDMSGYAAAARGYIRSADSVGMKILAVDRSRSANLKNKGIDQPILDMYNRLSQTVVQKDCPAVQHQVPDQFARDSRTSRSIAFTIFEMANVPSTWVPYCNDVDEIWTGSEYSKKSFLNSGVKVPVHVLPHAIDIDLFEDAQPWTISNKRGFTFLSVFDFTPRKNWQELLRAYWHAFKSKDDVCLILKVFFGDFSNDSRADIIRRILRYRNSLNVTDCAPILLYGYDVPNSDMAGLYKAADCYVGISKEGFGLSYCEAMAAGCACIGPEVGGTRQFMNEKNSFLIKYIGDEKISPEMVALNPIFDGLTWPQHDWQHLSEIMRQVVQNKDKRIEVAKNGKEFIEENLTFKAIGERMRLLLDEGLSP
jgi:glycosyltransferase involved in cell wall biosynthesis